MKHVIRKSTVQNVKKSHRINASENKRFVSASCRRSVGDDESISTIRREYNHRAMGEDATKCSGGLTLDCLPSSTRYRSRARITRICRMNVGKTIRFELREIAESPVFSHVKFEMEITANIKLEIE